MHVEPWRLPDPVGREAVIPVAGGVVVAGGLHAGDSSTSATYRLDLTTGRITGLADLPVAVHDVAGASANGSPVVLGGGNASEQDVIQVAGSDGRWRVTGHLPGPRSDLSAVTVGRRVVVLGGYDGTVPALADILLSTNGGAFHVVGRLPLPVRYAAVAYLHGYIWVFGGERNGVEVSAIQRIDLSTGRAAIVGHLPVGLGHASAAALGDRILLIGGRTGDGSQLSPDLWWCDPAASTTVHPAGRLPMPLSDSAIVTVGRSAYLIGGETPQLSAHVVRISVS